MPTENFQVLGKKSKKLSKLALYLHKCSEQVTRPKQVQCAQIHDKKLLHLLRLKGRNHSKIKMFSYLVHLLCECDTALHWVFSVLIYCERRQEVKWDHCCAVLPYLSQGIPHVSGTLFLLNSLHGFISHFSVPAPFR